MDNLFSKGVSGCIYNKKVYIKTRRIERRKDDDVGITSSSDKKRI